MILEHIRLSEQAREQLIKLKRVTGIKHWNVLCRWAFCTSLAEPTAPAPVKIPADSSVQMTWKVFAGDLGDVFAGLLHERCVQDGYEPTPEVLATQLRLHIHRGVGYLFADKKMRGIAGLFRRLPLSDDATIES